MHGGPVVPIIARSSVVFDSARIGTLVRSVRAAGTLVPDRVHVVATTAEGLVTDIAIRAGSRVAAGTVVAVLRNPDLDAAVEDARAQLGAARAELRSAREEANAARLDRAGAYRSALAEAERASEESRTDASLIRDGLIGTLQYRQATSKANETHALAEIAARKIGVDAALEDAKVAAAQAVVDRVAATLAADRAHVDTLVVRAGSSGVAQSVTADTGQRLTLGAELARIAEERDLKAVLQVAEGDMRGVARRALRRPRPTSRATSDVRRRQRRRSSWSCRRRSAYRSPDSAVVMRRRAYLVPRVSPRAMRPAATAQFR